MNNINFNANSNQTYEQNPQRNNTPNRQNKYEKVTNFVLSHPNFRDNLALRIIQANRDARLKHYRKINMENDREVQQNNNGNYNNPNQNYRQNPQRNSTSNHQNKYERVTNFVLSHPNYRDNLAVRIIKADRDARLKQYRAQRNMENDQEAQQSNRDGNYNTPNQQPVQNSQQPQQNTSFNQAPRNNVQLNQGNQQRFNQAPYNNRPNQQNAPQNNSQQNTNTFKQGGFHLNPNNQNFNQPNQQGNQLNNQSQSNTSFNQRPYNRVQSNPQNTQQNNTFHLNPNNAQPNPGNQQQSFNQAPRNTVQPNQSQQQNTGFHLNPGNNASMQNQQNNYQANQNRNYQNNNQHHYTKGQNTNVPLYAQGVFGGIGRKSGKPYIMAIIRKRRDINPNAPHAGGYVSNYTEQYGRNKGKISHAQFMNMRSYQQMMRASGKTPLTENQIRSKAQNGMTVLHKAYDNIAFNGNIMVNGNQSQRTPSGHNSLIVNPKSFNQSAQPFSFQKEQGLNKAAYQQHQQTQQRNRANNIQRNQENENGFQAE